MVADAHGLEQRLRLHLVGAPQVVARHGRAGRGVRVAGAVGELLAALDHVFHGLQVAVLAHDQQRPVARVAVLVDHGGEHLAVGAVDGFHGRLVAEPADLHLVEAHAFDDAGVVGGEERLDRHAERLAQVVDQRLPGGLQVRRRFRRDKADVQGLGVLGVGGQGHDARGDHGEKGSAKHV
ncbi:hypothetical protein D3C86_1561640 [compost metagenome]